MATNKRIEVYKSFEQLKSELFPRLSQEEARKSTKWGSDQDGASSAEKAVDSLLKERADRDA